MERSFAPDFMTYTLKDVTAQCTFDFFAPYNTVGNRLQNFVNINSSGLVTPLSLGTNLVQVRHGNEYIIARIQVHDEIKGWRFGDSSITTAKDAVFAHSQPSLYALFSDDPSGTDLVGDSTGHKYVTLSSRDDSIFTVDANGRLQGFQEQEGNAVGDAKLNGAFLTQSHTLNVKVFDYAKPRKKLTTGRIKIYLGPKRK